MVFIHHRAIRPFSTEEYVDDPYLGLSKTEGWRNQHETMGLTETAVTGNIAPLIIKNIDLNGVLTFPFF